MNIFHKCRYIFHTRSICKKQTHFYQRNDRQFGKKAQKPSIVFFLWRFFFAFLRRHIFLGGMVILYVMGFCLQGSGIFVPRIIDLKHSNQLHLLVVEPSHLKNPSDPFCSRSFGVGLVLGAVLHLRLIGDITGALGPGDVTGHPKRVRLGLSCPAFFQVFCLPRRPAWRIIPVNFSG